MRNAMILVVAMMIGAGVCSAQIVDDLSNVAVWSFGPTVWCDSVADVATYIEPQFIKRAWFKYSSMPGNPFTNPLYGFPSLPPAVNGNGALFEGGVQVPQLTREGGWHCDNPYDDDHVYPFEIPDPVYYDFVTLNADGEIYYQPTGPFGFTITNGTIANENYLDYCLYWAFEQLDAGVNALEFDQVEGAYELDFDADSTNNKNIGYDDYTIGAANFATRLSVVFGHGYDTPVEWFVPTASASSNEDSAFLAFDDNFSTSWRSDTCDTHWVMIDFGRIRTIRQVYLRFPAEHIPGNFYVVYWDGAIWRDFEPPLFDISNADSIRSFLVEPARAEKVLLSSTESEIWLSEMQLFGQGFRQFLLQRYCVDSGWTPTDARWETQKLIELSDTLVCPDGTMNSFNYRRYLQAHEWTLNPFGGELTWETMLDPPNKLFLDWFPRDYHLLLTLLFYDDDFTVNLVNDLFERSFMYELIYLNWWRTIADSVRAYAASLGREVFITYNGSAYCNPHFVDYSLAPMFDGLNFPAYHCPTATDTDGVCLIGNQAQINIWRLIKRRAVDYLGEDVPLVAFCDFWQLGMPFAHLGGIDEPADERAIYIRTYGMEMRAAGVNFCFPVQVSDEDSWTDTLSDGTPLIEIIKQQADFLNAYFDIYKNATVSDNETLVTVNGIVPFNGEWNIDWESGGLRFDSPVNESNVTIAYTYAADSSRAYLHIINHNWDSAGRVMLPQESVPVTVPVSDTCRVVMLVSPDFPDTVYPEFDYEDGIISLVIPVLEYYDIIILDFADTTKIAEGRSRSPLGIAISACPNPFNSSLRIEALAGADIEIYDINGRLVENIPAKDESVRPDPTMVIWAPDKDIPSGVYLIKASVEKGTVVKKVIYLK
ncbi:T9SS type A sorting domain-containing protein [bacterium]|nr:T9SS type A sorting domain-containing protein [bacterium]